MDCSIGIFAIVLLLTAAGIEDVSGGGSARVKRFAIGRFHPRESSRSLGNTFLSTIGEVIRQVAGSVVPAEVILIYVFDENSPIRTGASPTVPG